ncbi:hypothetical protein HELRODRAFT_179568 [Helobdella robusta]|uniref:Uncharacterized protein n=1 Tax=Helobdella robusta TaxID=6412 RepID=T1FEV9_HELRO|nr:hypothetical protein HELRODRAFT_179568 [Helobdella robusta]ESN95232.1 hypothetical protein HELRODRAFT_179568 [Helobdella robusta]
MNVPKSSALPTSTTTLPSLSTLCTTYLCNNNNNNNNENNNNNNNSINNNNNINSNNISMTTTTTDNILVNNNNTNNNNMTTTTTNNIHINNNIAVTSAEGYNNTPKTVMNLSNNASNYNLIPLVTIPIVLALVATVVLVVCCCRKSRLNKVKSRDRLRSKGSNASNLTAVTSLADTPGPTPMTPSELFGNKTGTTLASNELFNSSNGARKHRHVGSIGDSNNDRTTIVLDGNNHNTDSNYNNNNDNNNNNNADDGVFYDDVDGLYDDNNIRNKDNNNGGNGNMILEIKTMLDTVIGLFDSQLKLESLRHEVMGGQWCLKTSEKLTNKYKPPRLQQQIIQSLSFPQFFQKSLKILNSSNASSKLKTKFFSFQLCASCPDKQQLSSSNSSFYTIRNELHHTDNFNYTLQIYAYSHKNINNNSNTTLIGFCLGSVGFIGNESNVDDARTPIPVMPSLMTEASDSRIHLVVWVSLISALVLCGIVALVAVMLYKKKLKKRGMERFTNQVSTCSKTTQDSYLPEDEPTTPPSATSPATSIIIQLEDDVIYRDYDNKKDDDDDDNVSTDNSDDDKRKYDNGIDYVRSYDEADTNVSTAETASISQKNITEKKSSVRKKFAVLFRNKKINGQTISKNSNNNNNVNNINNINTTNDNARLSDYEPLKIDDEVADQKTYHKFKHVKNDDDVIIGNEDNNDDGGEVKDLGKGLNGHILFVDNKVLGSNTHNNTNTQNNIVTLLEGITCAESSTDMTLRKYPIT